MKEMDFPEVDKVNYDPKHIISQRRYQVGRSTFDHEHAPNLVEFSNLLSFDFDQNIGNEV